MIFYFTDYHLKGNLMKSERVLAIKKLKRRIIDYLDKCDVDTLIKIGKQLNLKVPPFLEIKDKTSEGNPQ